ncbi:MAG: hypothetical protein LBM07_05240 [Culturomica sp.]|jgi:carbon monoxide dehydrogenase subunit G|nr:hypothetical protein [Culturomica sp.]
MASLEITSNVVKIDSEIENVFSFYSDFNKIGNFVSAARQLGIINQLPEEMSEFTKQVKDVRWTTNECVITLEKLGDMNIKIVEKEHPKLIKFSTSGQLPIEITIWIQLLQNGPYDTRMRLTFHSDMNMMLKMMLKGKIEKGINQLAEAMAKIPYSLLSSMPAVENPDLFV